MIIQNLIMLKFSPFLLNFRNKSETTSYRVLTCVWSRGGWGMYMIDSRYCLRHRACSVPYTSSYRAWYRDTPSMAALTRDGNPGQCQRSKCHIDRFITQSIPIDENTFSSLYPIHILVRKR